ncbi:hypothetical protein ACOMHN_041735 [Nucella lapillus]
MKAVEEGGGCWEGPRQRHHEDHRQHQHLDPDSGSVHYPGWGGVTGTSHLPKPWLSLDRKAKVLHLVCKTPPEASSWEQVHHLKLFAHLTLLNLPYSVSLVNVTNRKMTKPLTNPMYSISWASFQGSWPDKSVSLEFKFPVTDKDLGRYFCVVVYSKSDGIFTEFSTQVDVKDFVFSHVESAVTNKQNFQVSVVNVHHVRVTWTEPTQSKFSEASVSRVLVRDGGKIIGLYISLITTDGITNYTGSQVLLTNVSLQGGSSNMSITLYVKEGHYGAAYRYSCWVPYSACTGHNERFCMCCQQSNNPDREMCPLSPGDCSPENCSREDCSREDCSREENRINLTILIVLICFTVLYVVCKIVLWKWPECWNSACALITTARENPRVCFMRCSSCGCRIDYPTPVAGTSHEPDPPDGESEGDTNHNTDPPPTAGTSHEADPPDGQRG